ncbi:NAD(P)/FAD-dependent oxidoreductase [Pseudomonas [fluorescens] ATCC 17400]|uniref:NAD(P)/FAD-dependent oxidoreductase n=1 Tax=Pseudomonas TaxID=286 RepID=UPI00049324EE|nr:tryptophan 7-halogenase [Pseudomonas sp. 06C 126]OHW38685.1 hypothetical protein BHC62_23500 [Pseudomonas sp. 06C 126]
MKRIAIMGAGVAGHLAALYFKKRLPGVEVILIGRPDRKRPIVGESTVELTTHFFKGLGLGRLLEEKHYHKYGLTYYLKLRNNPECRNYVVHEAPGVIRMPAYNLNRFSFDKDLRKIVGDHQVHMIEADVSAVDLNAGEHATHLLTLRSAADEQQQLTADWVVDATGRNRFMAKKLKLHKEATYQRSTFWLRLKDFDRSILSSITAHKDKHHCYDPYYVTHHFYGKGYWIWMIPMRSDDGNEMISIGITYRPDMIEQKISTLEAFKEKVMADHPVITELIESGQLVDTQAMHNYMYEARQYYSTEGWFLLGDAAFTFDPANSAGLAYVAQQIPQVAAMIEKDIHGSLTPAYVNCLESHIQAQLALQDTWSKWYEVMDDPFMMGWTLLFANMAYFHVVLPMYMTGDFLDGHQAQQFADLLPRYTREMQPSPLPFACLLQEIRRSNPGLSPTMMPNLYSRTINFDLYKADNRARPIYASNYYLRSALLRVRLMKMVKWSLSTRHLRLLLRHGCGAVQDLARAAVLRLRPSLFYKYGESPELLKSPFGKDGGFLDLVRRA